MNFWIAAAALTFFSVLIAFWPLLARKGDLVSEAEHDLQVYRDQLRELDDEVARGVMNRDDARQAQTEISRRILAASDRATAATKAGAGRGRIAPLAIAVFGLAFVIGLTAIVYGGLGSPTMPAQPLAARLEAQRDVQQAQAAANSQMRTLIERAEAQLAANPQDGRGWDVLAPVYLRLGDTGRAVAAYESALRLLGPSGLRYAGYGEALVATANGLVSEPALDAFRSALEVDPAEPRARFFVALAAAQSGKLDDARNGWQVLAADENAAAEWRAVANSSLEQLASVEAAGAGRPPALEGETLAQSQDMSADERKAMISEMVAGLDERLRASPDDIDGWKRLIRARVVLEDVEALRETLQRARAAYETQPARLSELKEFAVGFGVNVEEIWQ